MAESGHTVRSGSVREDALVIGLDSSTQSTKAIAWNCRGEAVAEGRADIAMNNPRLDFYEQDPLHWWESCRAALRDCTDGLDTQRLAGLAISNQRETVAVLDEHGDALYPAMLWLDERARSEVASFSASFGAENIHRITGRYPDITPALYRFLWLREHEPEVFAQARHYVDVQAYLIQRLCGGPYRTSWSSADPMGIFDVQAKCWSESLLEATGLRSEQLAEASAPGTLLGRVARDMAEQTGLPHDLPVFAGGGDGQCAGLGTNCTIPDRAYINLGTAVVSGIWSPEYRYGSAWRTEVAAQGEGYVYENCLRSGAFLINWFVERFVARGRADADVFDALEVAAERLPIGSDGLLVQPYFAGTMDPHWDVNARGIIMGLSCSHTEAHIYRAILEAITLDQVMRTQDTEAAAGQEISHYVAIGGGANSVLWRQMLADAAGKPVHVSNTVEASALGAGMIAATGAGWYPSITAAAQAMASETTPVMPDASRSPHYQRLLEIYRPLYAATAEITRQLGEFAAQQRQAPG